MMAQRTLFEIAVHTGQTDLVDVLLNYENVNLQVLDSEGRSMLSVASMKGYTKIVELLLSTDKAQNYQKEKLGGNSPLHWSAMSWV